jgi:hypothetical protein
VPYDIGLGKLRQGRGGGGEGLGWQQILDRPLRDIRDRQLGTATAGMRKFG